MESAAEKIYSYSCQIWVVFYFGSTVLFVKSTDPVVCRVALHIIRVQHVSPDSFGHILYEITLPYRFHLRTTSSKANIHPFIADLLTTKKLKRIDCVCVLFHSQFRNLQGKSNLAFTYGGYHLRLHFILLSKRDNTLTLSSSK